MAAVAALGLSWGEEARDELLDGHGRRGRMRRIGSSAIVDDGRRSVGGGVAVGEPIDGLLLGLTGLGLGRLRHEPHPRPRRPTSQRSPPSGVAPTPDTLASAFMSPTTITPAPPPPPPPPPPPLPLLAPPPPLFFFCDGLAAAFCRLSMSLRTVSIASWICRSRRGASGPADRWQFTTYTGTAEFDDCPLGEGCSFRSAEAAAAVILVPDAEEGDEAPVAVEWRGVEGHAVGAPEGRGAEAALLEELAL